MGWKASTIIVTPKGETDLKFLLQELGFANLAESKSAPFEVAINPPDNEIYVGSFKNNLLICLQDLPIGLLTNENPDQEKILTERFPDSEICVMVLHSVVNLWGYLVIRNGKRIRAKAGSSDGTFRDEGLPLKEELPLLHQSYLNDGGERMYRLEGFPGEEFSEDQVGEDLVFNVCQRYFNEPLDRADDLLFETMLTGYRINLSSPHNSKQPTPAEHTQTKAKSWWKFWG